MTTIPKHLADRLPEAARGRLRYLDEELQETNSLYRGCQDELQDIGRRIRHLETERERSDLSDEAKLAVMKDTREPLAALSESCVRQNERSAVFSMRQQRLGGLVQGIEAWLKALPPNAVLAEHAGSSNKSGDREVTPDAIEKRQRRIRELLADIARTDAAPYPNAEAKQLARKEIEALAERGRPSLFSLIERRESIGWPTRQLRNSGIGSSDIEAPDGIALLAWIHRGALIAAIEKAIDEEADDSQAFTDAQRRERFKTLLGDLLAVEREEEALIKAAGFRVDRRIDADPRAVLGLASALPGPKRDLVHRRLIDFADNVYSEPRPAPSNAEALHRSVDQSGQPNDTRAPSRFFVPRSV